MLPVAWRFIVPDDLTLTKLLGASLARRVKKEYPHCHAGLAYALDVVAGRQVACKWVKLACQRQLDDLAAWRAGEREGWRFDWIAAERVCKFIGHLRHVKGKWAAKRETITLEPWQSFILTVVFGWHVGERRRFRTVYEECARKNAKTTKGSGVALYCGFVEGEAGAEVYSAATGHDQARIAFDIARLMVLKDDELAQFYGIEARAHVVCSIDQAAKFESLSSDVKGLDGRNPHMALVDEFHAHKTPEVRDSLETGMGAREQPLLWYVTTAGSNRSGPCYATRSYATKVLEGTIEDDAFFGVIFTIDEGDDWTSEEVWEKANPNLGVSVFPDYLRSKCKQAQDDPLKQTQFLTKNLNVWVSAESRLVNMLKWDACGEPFDMNDLKGVPCFVGVDMASTQDVAPYAMVWDVDGEVYVKLRYYLPRELVMEHAHGTHAHYAGWAAEGRFTLTPGNSIDFDQIMSDLRDLPSQGFLVQEIAFDPWRATEMVTRLQEAGAVAVEVPNNARHFSEPTKKILSLVADGKFHHGGDPVLAWMVSNVVGHFDNKDNVYPKKERRSEKIDGFIAIVLAMSRMIRHQAAPVSQYGRGAKMVTSAGGAENG